MTIELTPTGASVIVDGEIAFDGTIAECRDYLDMRENIVGAGGDTPTPNPAQPATAQGCKALSATQPARREPKEER